MSPCLLRQTAPDEAIPRQPAPSCAFLGLLIQQQTTALSSCSPIKASVYWERLSLAGHKPNPELQYFLNRSRLSAGPKRAAAGLAVI